MISIEAELLLACVMGCYSWLMDFHAHIYFDSSTRETAKRIRDRFAHSGLPGLATLPLPAPDDPLRGPHPSPMFELGFGREAFSEVVGWLLLHRGAHPVLVHAVTGNDLVDHDRHALWLGEPQRLDLSRLDPPIQGWHPVSPEI